MNIESLQISVREHQALIEEKFSELDQTPHGALTGRRLEFAGRHGDGSLYTPVQIREVMARGFADIANRLGADFVRITPAVVLEQLIIVSIQRNEDSAGLLKSLLNSFMITYMTPETSGEAFKALLDLERLRERVKQQRNTPATKH